VDQGILGLVGKCADGQATQGDRDGSREAQGTVEEIRSSHPGTLAESGVSMVNDG
jgi:hypothetical protein